jgi:DNA-binding NarL/FixJ family response regulator
MEMSTRTQVFVYGADPLSQAGVAAYLRECPEIELVAGEHLDEAEVALVIAEEVDEENLRVLRALQRDGTPRVVLLVTTVTDDGISEAIQAGAVGILRRSSLTRDSLRGAVQSAAHEEGVLSPDLLGGLLRQVRQIQANVLAPLGPGARYLSSREEAVLRLLSDGCDTREIARKLSYSERTVKTIIQDVTRRFGLRNRSHAVAYALRQGLI